jgi:hypothetical protein
MNLFHEAKKVLDKDGKVNPLGPYGKMKLTGQEVANYFRKNKVSDAKVKRAVEVALDMSGAMDIASKEIKKFFGDKILKSKEVQKALQYANEETMSEGMKMKDIFRKHKRELTKAYKSGDLSFMSSAGKKAEDDLMQWAMDNGEVNTDDPDDFFDWLSRDLEDIVKGKIKEEVEVKTLILPVILEKAYDKADVKKVQQLEKKLQGMLKEVDKTMRGSGLSAPAFNNVRSGIQKGLESIQKFYKIANTSSEETISENADMVLHVDDKLQANLVIKYASKFGLKSKKQKISWSGKDGVVVSGDADKLKKFMSSVEDVFKEESIIDENYRTLAKHGMGAETPKSIKVGTEVDYYQKDGAKYMGKITKMSRQSYTVRDDKTKKDHEFFYHDRIKAKKLLKQGDNIQEGYFMKEMEDGQYFPGAEKMYVDIIKKAGGKNIKVYKPSRMDPQLGIDFKGGNISRMQQELKKKGDGTESVEEAAISEKVEYVEYKFRNKRDAQKALDYFKRQQLIKLDINDDGLSQYELAIDAGKNDMTKQHKEVMKMLKPKVMTQEAVSPAQQAAIAIDRKEKRSKGAYKNVMDSYRQMWQDASIEEGKYAKYSDLLLKKAREMQAIDKAQNKSGVKSPSLNALKSINKEIEKEMKKLGISESINEAMITYRVKKMQKPEEQKFTRSAKMMGLKITMDKGRDDTVIVMSGTKKKLRDFDAVARGKSSFGDPSTITHFDEK